MSQDLINWLEIECIYCNEVSNLQEYHHSYRMKCNDNPPVYYLTCPKCEKRMILKSFELGKEAER